MSLGGLRDPLDPDRDSFSQLEADAVAYAVRERRCSSSQRSETTTRRPRARGPTPAIRRRLPHVLGVSALARDRRRSLSSRTETGSTTTSSAPGEQILSIFPRPLTSRFPACAEQGFSSCGPDEYREAQGTSFSAPQVTRRRRNPPEPAPSLRPEQTSAILRALRGRRERGDRLPCVCDGPRRALGLGPPRHGRGDRRALEPASASRPTRGERRRGAAFRGIAGSDRRVTATVDFWDDQDDVYAIGLRKGQRVYVGADGSGPRADLNLALWLPQTESIDDVRSFRWRARLSARPGGREYLSYRARAAGTYFVQVRMSAPGRPRTGSRSSRARPALERFLSAGQTRLRIMPRLFSAIAFAGAALAFALPVRRGLLLRRLERSLSASAVGAPCVAGARRAARATSSSLLAC